MPDRERAGELWQENGRLFASRVGTALAANNVIRAFPHHHQEGRSRGRLGAPGDAVETIAVLMGHEQTAATELIYRHEIRPALTAGAEIIEQIFAE